MDFSDDEKIVLGEFCEHVLRSEAFAAITKHYEASTLSELTTTKPQETKRRDELYFNLWGARDLVKLMADLVKEKYKLLENDQPKPSDPDESFSIYDVVEDEGDDVS